MLRTSGSTLFIGSAAGLAAYDVRGQPTLVARHEEPTELNPFGPDPAGERVTDLRRGLFARSFTPPGQTTHCVGHRGHPGLRGPHRR